MSRRALTLIEALVVLAIIGILVALLLPAIQQIRLQSHKVTAMNTFKQVMLASHQYADRFNDLLPDVAGNYRARPFSSVWMELSLFMEFDPYKPPKRWLRFPSDPSIGTRPRDYLPPIPLSDKDGPVAPRPDVTESVTSVAFNPMIYNGQLRFSNGILDGKTYSIGATEHYSICDAGYFDWGLQSKTCGTIHGSTIIYSKCNSNAEHRATFADTMFEDVYPVTSNINGNPVTKGSLPLTFQVRPELAKCDSRIPQSSFPGGILCAYMDGSVRFVAEKVNETVFWGGVTPSAGENLGVD